MITKQEKTKITAAVDSYMGRKYCSNCQSYQPLLKGKWIRTKSKNGGRWKCQSCMERMTNVRS